MKVTADVTTLMVIKEDPDIATLLLDAPLLHVDEITESVVED